jgi:signal transduction histidine kinase
MKMFSIRQWMLVGIAICALIAVVVYHGTSLFIPAGNNELLLVVEVLAVTLALLFIRWQMGRYVVTPLEAMSAAARRIAEGNLDFALPESQVREVADVRAAFETMGAGLRESLKRQAELEEERRFFIGAIAHDLRTPLFALRGYLEGLDQGLAASPEKAATYVAVCRQKADQLDRLVADLVAYTRAEYLEQTRQPEPLEVGALLHRAIEGARARAGAKGITLELDGAHEACLAVGDAHLLERAVENLLDNALRYTPAGGRIVVGWQQERTRVVFTVADTGPGIAPGDLPHLFDPLYRGEASRNRQTGGAGLGLAIARRALRADGGGGGGAGYGPPRPPGGRGRPGGREPGGGGGRVYRLAPAVRLGPQCRGDRSGGCSAGAGPGHRAEPGEAGRPAKPARQFPKTQQRGVLNLRGPGPRWVSLCYRLV